MRPSPLPFVILVVVAMACATTKPRPPADAPVRSSEAATKPGDPPPRLKDSAPERAAATRGAATNLQLEQEDQRWGIEAARERKRREQEKAAPAAEPTPADGTSRSLITPVGPGPVAPAPK